MLKRDFTDLWAQLSFDCLVGTQEAMRFLIESEGANRVMLGANFAGWDQEDDIAARVTALGLSGEVTALVMGAAARRYFKLVHA